MFDVRVYKKKKRRDYGELSVLSLWRLFLVGLGLNLKFLAG